MPQERAKRLRDGSYNYKGYNIKQFGKTQWNFGLIGAEGFDDAANSLKEAKLFIDETVKDEPINGDYQELAYGTFIRWSIGGTSSATSSKYYTNDEWEIEFDGQPIESGSGIGALQVIRSDY